MNQKDRKVTTDLLRHRIDHGQSGDKKGFPDPAAAPLGTDDEAAGTSPTPAQIERAWDHEVRNRPNDQDVTETGPVRPGKAERRPDPRIWILLAAVAMLGAIVFAAMA